MSGFEYELGAEVKIGVSGERGVVIGRAQYLDSKNCYYLRYMAADGRATESWWNEGALTR